ncbi:hypothetical protein [Bradyrhizobium sp. 144]|uniref:hypothetical protein n=1 Tax=Bradyrhizobium sp. 144 TaxID=2782620 RepID=UPI001FFB73B6|nr:hypothetical protein [Bradyrhizobium sp. 144]MCK1695224.1 hypothetical protein [Bradyrhizobium sp. 144]
MSIFDDIARENDQPRQEGEPLFSYLNKSSRPEAERVRTLVDEWIKEYPESHREPLVARLRSDIDDQHQSAFFELFLHHFLCARGCKIIEIEPKLEHTDKSPDFLVETSTGERFYLEAVLASGRSSQETAAYARLNTALAAIDNVPSPDNFLSLTTEGLPTAPLSLKKLKRGVQSWIAGLPAGIAAKDAAAFKYVEHGCSIELRALPRSKREEEGGAVGVRNFPVTQITPHQEIRPGLKKKASRYGKLEFPYVVAIDCLSMYHREEGVVDALLGEPYVEFTRMADGTLKQEHRRRPDGIWYGPPNGQPQNTRLSAVLAFFRIDAWNFVTKTGLLVPNPWAAMPIPQLNLGTTELTLANGAYQRSEGQPVGALLGMPEQWPEA